MILKIFISSILNSTTLKPNILSKKKFLIKICKKSKFFIQKNFFFKKKFTLCSIKTRAEIRGGGRKPYKQKGTGNSRIGSIRSPLKRGGGKSFGPRPSFTHIKINRKEKKLLVKTLIYNARFKYLIFNTLQTDIIFLKIIAYYKKLFLIIFFNKNTFLNCKYKNLKNFQYSFSYQLKINFFLNAKCIIFDFLSLLLINKN